METTQTESISTRTDDEGPGIHLQRVIRAQSTTTIAVAVFLFTVAIMFAYRPFSQAEVGDSALYDYLAQAVVRGQLPYRDVVEIKAPASFYLSALAMKAGSVLGVRDVIAARLLHIILAGLLAAIAYLVSEAYFHDRFAGLVAALAPLMSEHFNNWTVGGGQPKLSMIVFGMLTVLLIAKDRPVWAGLCSMLSCLCWQPGLLFTGTAFLVFSGYLTRWRDLRALKVLIGAAIPLLAVVLYFQSRGGLNDLWTWTIAFNYGVNAHKTLRTASESLTHLWAVSLKVFGAGLILLILSAVGFLQHAIARARARTTGIEKLASRESYRDAILIAPAVYLGFCLIRFSAAPYLLPAFPFLALFAGRAIALLTARLKESSRFTFVRWIPSAVLIAIVATVFWCGLLFQFDRGLTLQEQDRSFEVISAALRPDDSIYVHGTIEILVLTNRANLNGYVFLDWGKDDYLAAGRPGGFADVVREMEAQAPKVVALSRLQKVTHRADLIDWMTENYEPLDVKGYDGVYVRTQQQVPKASR